MSHSLLAPSASSRWMACPGSMSFAENREQGESNAYADDGSATHAFAAEALDGHPKDIGAVVEINGKEYTLDEERAERVQGYVDDVRRRAIGGHILVEQHVDLSDYLGQGQGGTADAVIILPERRLGVVEDLKDGSEKVFASYIVRPATDTEPELRAPNPQLALYALGMLPAFDLYDGVDSVLLVIYQPKLDHIDEYEMPIDDLLAFGQTAANAALTANYMATTAVPPDFETSLAGAAYFRPGKTQCRWCRAKARCGALKKMVQEETYSDFEDMEATPPAVPVTDRAKLSRAYAMIPLIEDWCAAVKAELQQAVTNGEKIIGPDGQPYKYVEGKEGARKWISEEAAIAALAGQLPPEKMYTQPKVITAPQAAKLLNKKATANLWNDIFEPLISRPRGKPILTVGSDQRPVFTGSCETSDYEDIDQ